MWGILKFDFNEKMFFREKKVWEGKFYWKIFIRISIRNSTHIFRRFQSLFSWWLVRSFTLYYKFVKSKLFFLLLQLSFKLHNTQNELKQYSTSWRKKSTLNPTNAWLPSQSSSLVIHWNRLFQHNRMHLGIGVCETPKTFQKTQLFKFIVWSVYCCTSHRIVGIQHYIPSCRLKFFFSILWNRRFELFFVVLTALRCV